MKPQIIPKSLDEATPEERRAYAQNFLNIDIALTANDDEVTAAIRQAQPNSGQIFVMGELDQAEQAGTGAQEAPPAEVNLRPEEDAGRMTGTLGKGDPRATIEIQVVETEDGKGGDDVFVGVNGRGWQLKRGVLLDVPWRVVEALDHAEADIIRHSHDEGREGEIIKRTAKRFPYIFHSKPSEQEIADWHERTDAEFCA